MKIELNEISFDGKIIVKEQEITLSDMTLIRGKSGAGKSLTLKQIAAHYDCAIVSQDPDNQIVCDKVWHEMAFGLENIGMKTSLIRARVAEIATYLGIDEWINKDVTELSGGQKQKLCLAAVLCMLPKMILLDEPTSMLDPISAREFWGVVERLNKERGIHFLIVVHDDEYAAKICNRHFLLDDGMFVETTSQIRDVKVLTERKSEIVYELHSLRKSYGSNLVVNIPKLEIHKGINCWIGPNGVGKSTLLRMICGAYKEKKLIRDSVLMPQDVKIMFSHDTVAKEIDCLTDEVSARIRPFLLKHPLDLSGGEQHIVGVTLSLLRNAALTCFDEPTKGMDYETKKEIMDIIRASGKTCVIVTHDLDLVAEYADYVIFLFNRDIAAAGSAKEVIGSNVFWKAEGIIFA